MGGNHHHNGRRRIGPPDEEALKRLRGYEAREREAAIGSARWDAEVERSLEIGLPAAESVEDRTISTFSRTELPHFAGINTFMNFPYLEDVREVGDYDVAILGAPFDMGTTYRSGTRFGPQAIRRISGLYSTYSYEFAVDLREQLRACDLGDIFVIPANIEKTFDQISRAVSHVAEKGVFPVILGGDHSIGYPCVRGIAPHIEGNVGGGYSYGGAAYVLAPQNLEPLAEKLHGALCGIPRVLASASVPTPRLCAVRILARDASALYRALNAFRVAARVCLDLPPAPREVW